MLRFMLNGLRRRGATGDTGSAAIEWGIVIVLIVVGGLLLIGRAHPSETKSPAKSNHSMSAPVTSQHALI